MSGERILCVDDEAPARRLARRLLERRGYAIDEAGDVVEARARLAGMDFDLVLLDVTMPGESGLELLRHLARERPEVATVMVTARDGEETAVMALDLNAYGYVIKPYEPNELLINVVNALRRKRLERAHAAYQSRLETELDRSREELRESEERFRSLGAPVRAAASSSLVYSILDADGAVRRVGERGRAVAADKIVLDGVVPDIAECKRLEHERDRMERELRIAQRFEAVGQLAAGIAHEINTPVQFVSDSVHFLRGAFDDLRGLVGVYRELCRETGSADVPRRAAEAEEAADLQYLDERVPPAFDRTRQGLERVATIVGAMKSFGHVAQAEKAPADLNDALAKTLIVASNELKYVADVETDLGELPPVHCNVGELGQVFLNLVVNAAHAIEHRGGERGTIRVSTRRDGDDVVVSVADTGCGIPAVVRDRIFDPFFTTKEVGRGSGQGLTLARSIVVDRHGGTIACESEVGTGTTMTVRLPVGGCG